MDGFSRLETALDNISNIKNKSEKIYEYKMKYRERRAWKLQKRANKVCAVGVLGRES